MNTETESYDIKLKKAWYHKKQLNCLTSFNDKLNYWLENIDTYPSPIQFTEGENAPFALSLEPQTDDDKRILNKYLVDYYRSLFAKERKKVQKFGWKWSELDPKPTAFTIQPLITLKSDLEVRLETAFLKKDLVKAELYSTTEAINAIGKVVNGVPSTLYHEINELRDCLKKHRSLDFAFQEVQDLDSSLEAVKLAHIWDIIHYESYLTTVLATMLVTKEEASIHLESHIKRGGQETIYNSFEELFFNPEDLQYAIEVFHKTTAENKFNVIDSKNYWLGKERDGSRSVLLAWIEVLRQQGWFKYIVPNNVMSRLLNSQFNGLKLSESDDSLWRKQKESTVANRYHSDFLAFIEKR